MATFAGETSLLTLLPLTYREADLDGSLQAFFEGVDQIWSTLVTELENFDTNVVSPSTNMVDYWLAHHANPFNFPMTDEQKLRLVNGLFRIYQLRGSKKGMLRAINYILGLDCDLQYDFEYCWRLGVSKLGVDTILMSESRPTARLLVAGVLDNDTLSAIKSIVEFMKPHWLEVQILGGAIIVPKSISLGTIYTARVLPVMGALSYTWSITNGTIVSGQGTNEIQFEGVDVGLLIIELDTDLGTTGVMHNTAIVSVYPAISGLSLIIGDGSSDAIYQYAGTFDVNIALSKSVYRVVWSADNLDLTDRQANSATFDVGRAGVYAAIYASVTDANGANTMFTQEIKVVPYTSNQNFVTDVLAPNVTQNIDLELGWEYIVDQVQVDRAAWVRIYNSALDRSNDSTRSNTVDPISRDIVVWEGTFDNILLIIPSDPTVKGVNEDSPRSKMAYLAITNLDSIPAIISGTITRTETKTSGSF